MPRSLSLEIKRQLISLNFPAPMHPFLYFLYILQKKERKGGRKKKKKKELEALKLLLPPLFMGEIPVLKKEEGVG